ncbi:hypothetical protein C0992_004430 [Termitomyces sp. T32_za158]|nr:hypothetical protein C0992_004430 [Termitomyces sp. T32_za158]
MVDVPWEEWKLDAKFLADLDRWAAENPETSFNRLLQQICTAMDPIKEFFEIIPDGSFPARGLVKSLAHVVSLGRTVTYADKDTRDFAMDVVRWVDDTRKAFSARQRRMMRRDFTRATWANLQEMRWAAARLSDKRWTLSKFLNKIRVQDEIEVFKQRLSDARAIFNEKQIISQSLGIDAVLDYLGMVSRGQRKMLKMLREFKADQKKQLNEIVVKLEEQADERHPTHEAQEKRPCDKDTRENVLREVTLWARDISPKSGNFLWLTGDPGCGKSAITASLVETARADNNLWGEFFINRNNPNTTNPNAYFPTIVRQFARRDQEARHRIYDHFSATGNTPRLAVMSSREAASLFVDAIRVASKIDTERPVIIIIDGLDETDRKHLMSTATIFAQLLNNLSDCPNAKIFISSRTEDEITNPFEQCIAQNKHVKHLHLDTEASFHDVASYLRRNIKDIWMKYKLPPQDFPGEEGQKKLADHASGLFIWAATAIKFFQQRAEDSELGSERLSSVLTDLTGSSKGLMDINALYNYIIVKTYEDRASSSDDAEQIYRTFRRLVGAIVVLSEPFSVSNLCRILNIPQILSILTANVIHFIKRLRTVLIPGTGAVHSQTVPRLHKSFFEYITGNHVDIRFRVDISASHRELFVCCLHQLVLAHSATASYKMPYSFRYATRFWLNHLSSSDMDSGVLITSPNQNFHEVGNLLRSLPSEQDILPIRLVVSGSSVVASVLGRTCAWDINSGLVQDGISIHESASVELLKVIPDYLTKVPPSRPTSAIVSVMPSDCTYISWVLPNDRFGLWNTKTREMKTLHILKRAKWTFSSGNTIDGGHFVETRDGVIHIWNIHTKVNEIRSINFFKETKKWKQYISCLTLSPSAHTLAAGCDDGTVHFWNLRYNPARLISSLSPPSVKKKSSVTMLVFSSDGTKALSCSEAEIDITAWTLFDSEVHHALLVCTGTASPRSLTFSNDGGAALSGHSDGKICIWDIKSKELTGSPITPSHARDSISAIYFSENGESILSGTERGRIDIWDIETRQLIASFRGGNDSVIGTISSATTQDHHLCVAGISELRLLEIQGKYNKLQLNNGHMDIAFSLVNSQVAALSQNNSVFGMQ